MSTASHVSASLETWMQSPQVQRLSSTLLHFVWQGVALAIVAFCLSTTLKRARPQVRYVVLLTLLAAMAACPLITWLAIPADGGMALPDTIARTSAIATPGALRGTIPPSAAVETAAHSRPARAKESAQESARKTAPAAETTAFGVIAAVHDAATTRANAFAILIVRRLSPFRPWIVTGWLLGVCLLGLRLAAGLAGAEVVRRRGLNPAARSVHEIVFDLAGRWGIRRTVRVFESRLAEVPTLVGWLAPVILLPASAICGLTPLQLRAILAHELAHVRRHDYLCNLLQTVVETLLFYQPAVWWLSRQIRQEREHCCDDMAVEICGDRIAYARALASLEERRSAGTACALAANGGSLAGRIRRIIGRPLPAQSDNVSLAAVGLVLILVLGSVFHFRPPAAAADAQPPIVPRANVLLMASANQPAIRQGPASTHKAVEFTFQVVTTKQKPIAGATVLPWAIGAGGGSVAVTEKHALAVKTDAEGIAHIVLTLGGDDTEAQSLRTVEKRGIDGIGLRVDHPGYPIWFSYLNPLVNRRIVLSEPTTIHVRAHREHDKTGLTRLFPVLSGSLYTGADWGEKDGVLTIRRVDLDSEKATRWLRVVHVPQAGSVLFSELIDLKRLAENPITLDVSMRPGVRVAGRLADAVPRPVANGHVVAAIIVGNDPWNNWNWSATARINPDGRFVLEALPPDENLQLIALCNGWVSASPTVREEAAYTAKNGFSDVNFYGSMQTFVYPRLYRLDKTPIEPVVPMLRTADCEVTVLDENGQPISGASVAFWPNQMFFNSGSSILGQGMDGLTLIRTQLTSGKHQTHPEIPPPANKSYSAKTDARGMAIVRNLALGGAEEMTTPTEMPVSVSHDGYVSTDVFLESPKTTVKLLPGQMASVSVHLKRK